MNASDVLDQSGSESTRFAKSPDLEPIPGYRLLEPLGSGGFGEVWKCEAPGGLLKAIKFVQGSRSALDAGCGPAEEELQAIQHVKAIRHPFLLSMERVECIDGELVIVLELADKNLQDLLVEYRDRGQPGIPRDELLGYLHEAAEALDLMNIHHGLQHLDIKPRNLFLVYNHVKVGDFGLVNSFRVGGSSASPKLQLGAITPLYAAPEIFQGSLSARSDQYSLAIVYQELLTGRLPFQGKNSRQLLMQHTGMEPDLQPLPPSDRAAVSRALAKDPAKRFATCTDFVEALATAPTMYASVRVTGQSSAKPRKQRQAAEDVRETPSSKAGTTEVVASRRSASLREETIAGHQLLRCLRSSPREEVWEARAPDGANKQLRIIFGFNGRAAEFSARLKSLQHPALVPTEVLDSEPGRLVLIADAIARSLRDRLQECQAQGLAGMPRAELIEYLRGAAEALDSLSREHSVQHLGLNPRTLLLDNDCLRLADFGLAQLVWLPAGESLGRRNGRYSAPELSSGQLSPACDQYSLALLYYELYTGSHAPRRGAGKTTTPETPNLDLLPAADRPVITRALHPVAQERWPTCLDMVRALVNASSDDAGAQNDQLGSGASEGGAISPLQLIINKLVAAAGGSSRSAVATQPAAAMAGKFLEGKFVASLPPGPVHPQLEAFRQEWNGQPVREEAGRYVFSMHSPVSFWQRCMGRQPGLEIEVRLAKAKSSASTEVCVKVRPQGCGKEQAAVLLAAYGPLILESARTHLQANSRRRAQERLAWHYPLEVCPEGKNGVLGEPIECQGKDISLGGIGFYLPEELPTARICIKLPRTSQTPAVAIPASIVRVKRCGPAWYEVGALFLTSKEPG